MVLMDLLLRWSEPALDIEWGLPFTLRLYLPCQGHGLLPTYWSRGLQICFLAVIWSVVWSRWDWNTATGREATVFFSLEVFTCECALLCPLSPVVWAHKVHCFWHCFQSFFSCGYACNWLWWLSGIFFHSGTSADPLRSGPRTAVVMHLYPLWELWRQLRLWSGPIPTCMCPQSPQLLNPDTSQLKEHSLSFRGFHRSWI